MNLPSDLEDFLNAGRQLDYDASECEMGKVTLKDVSSLQVADYPTDLFNLDIDLTMFPESGSLPSFTTEGVSLIAECEDYDPDGLLLWIPKLNSYGTWDCDHEVVSAFPSDVSWSMISNDPLRYLNAFWGDLTDEDTGLSVVLPWPPYRHVVQ